MLYLVVKDGCDAIVLGQVTMARAKASLLAAGMEVPVLTSPDECAGRLAQMFD